MGCLLPLSRCVLRAAHALAPARGASCLPAQAPGSLGFRRFASDSPGGQAQPSSTAAFETSQKRAQAQPSSSAAGSGGGATPPTRAGARGPAFGADGEREGQRQQQRHSELQDVMRRIEEKFGGGTPSPSGRARFLPAEELFSSGVMALDVALGGGWPRGRIVEIFGHESSGKTTLALHAMERLQKMKQTVVLIDAEHALDMSYARTIGVTTDGPDRVIVVQPNSGHDAMSIAEHFARSGLVSLVVVDSVSALLPQDELEAAFGGEPKFALHRLMSASLRHLEGAAEDSGCTIMLLNQIRCKHGEDGAVESTSASAALSHFTSIRCELKALERIYEASDAGAEEDVGFRCRARLVKSKVGALYQAAEFDLFSRVGSPWEHSLLEVAVQMGLVRKEDSFYFFGGEALHGKAMALSHLRNNPHVSRELEAAARASMAASMEFS